VPRTQSLAIRFLTRSAEEGPLNGARFTPTVLNGQPVKVQGVILITMSCSEPRNPYARDEGFPLRLCAFA